MSDSGVRTALRCRRRWVTHPVAPAVGVALAAAVLVGVLAAGGEEFAVAIGWVLLPLAAGYAVSGSP
ncbi:MAG: hypothetical protein M3313_05775 [Actinomycetota bacterium]|nr:hypothetical protein [Actinomycetota bacterium]